MKLILWSGKIKRRLLRIITVFFLVMITLFFVLHEVLKFRKEDKKVIAQFKKAGIDLYIDNIVVDPTIIHYACTGGNSLPTILFLHGSPGGWIEFEEFLKDKRLVANFRLISIDRPGFGYSDYGEARDLQEQAELISIFIQRMTNGQPLYLVGHSLEGTLAAWLAAEQLRRETEGILILAGALDPELEPEEKWRTSFINSPLKYLLLGAARQSNVELWYLKDMESLKNKLSAIICPVYGMHANNDFLVPVENVGYVQAQITNAEVYITLCEKGNHFITLR